jgi:hypothetical protein
MARDDGVGRGPEVTTKSALNRPDAHEFVVESCREVGRIVRQSIRGLAIGRRLKSIGRSWVRAGRQRTR